MSGYVDKSGRQRFVEIDLPSVERVLERTGVDLYSIDSVGQAASSVRDFLKVVHCISAPEEDYESWWKLHVGEVTDDCVTATMEALEYFYPPRLSQMIKTLREDSGRVIDEALATAERELANSFGKSPEPSGSVNSRE